MNRNSDKSKIPVGNNYEYYKKTNKYRYFINVISHYDGIEKWSIVENLNKRLNLTYAQACQLQGLILEARDF